MMCRIFMCMYLITGSINSRVLPCRRHAADVYLIESYACMHAYIHTYGIIHFDTL